MQATQPSDFSARFSDSEPRRRSVISTHLHGEPEILDVETFQPGTRLKPMSRDKTEAYVSQQSVRSARSSTSDAHARPVRQSSFPTTNSTWTRWATKWWIFEIVSSALSLILFGGLVALVSFTDSSQPELGPYLTVNALLALLCTLMRATMIAPVASAMSQMKWNCFSPPRGKAYPGAKLGQLIAYDQASRGPWGSLKLLCSGPVFNLGFIGATITILALAFDTFTQQVISYETWTLPNGLYIGAIPRSETYTNVLYGDTEADFVPDNKIKAAIYNGLFDYASVTSLSVQCSGYACQWDSVLTLAVCGGCTDVTAKATSTCVTSSTAVGYQDCEYHVADGDGYDFSTITDSNGTLAQGNALVVTPFVSTAYNASNMLYLESFIVVDTSSRRTQPVNVQTCGLWWCMQSHTVNVTSGVQTQQIITSNYSYVADQLNYTSNNYDFIDIPYHDFGISYEYLYNTSEYGVGYDVQAAIKNYTIVNATVQLAVDSGRYLFDSDIAQAVWNVSDWNFWIDQMALSLTNAVRLTGNVANKTLSESLYQGTVFKSGVIVNVRWLWLIFPGSLVLVSIAFLCLSIRQTQTRKTQLWKGDALALLYCKVDEDMESDDRDMRQGVVNDNFTLHYDNGVGVLRKVRTI